MAFQPWMVVDVEAWRALLEGGHVDQAWSTFIDRYHRLIDATIRRVVADHDDALDAFSHALERLRCDDLARLRKFSEREEHRAKFSTWLVVVVRNLALDWRRARDGRPRHAPPAELSPLCREIYRLVLVQRCSHVEAYEMIATSAASLSFGAFLNAVSETYRAVDARRRGHLAQAAAEFAAADAVDTQQPSDEPVEDTADRVSFAMRSLTDNEREAIRLFIVEELPAAEVAKAVGWSDAKMVYNRVRRALRKARDELHAPDQ